MEKFWVVLYESDEYGLRIQREKFHDEGIARGAAKDVCQSNGIPVYVTQVIAAYERPEPQVVEHNLVRKHANKAAPPPPPAPKARKKKAPPDLKPNPKDAETCGGLGCKLYSFVDDGYTADGLCNLTTPPTELETTSDARWLRCQACKEATP